jgi:hypothetical protein
MGIIGIIGEHRAGTLPFIITITDKTPLPTNITAN